MGRLKTSRPHTGFVERDVHGSHDGAGVRESTAGQARLAPDICEAILQGTQPPDLSLKKLLRGLPLSWQEQRQKFGFPTP